MISTTPMNNGRIEMLVSQVGTMIDGQPGYWRFLFAERELLCITDESHNRMRVMTPVVEESELSDADIRTLMAANFDRALDARYALSGEVLWAVYVHPLKDLSDALFCDAVEQVNRLAENFGSSYMSLDIVFDGD